MKVKISRKRGSSWRSFVMEDGAYADAIAIKQGSKVLMMIQINDDGGIEFYNVKDDIEIVAY